MHHNCNYLGRDDGYTPNMATYLFVLIHKFRLTGMSYADALAKARAVISR